MSAVGARTCAQRQRLSPAAATAATPSARTSIQTESADTTTLSRARAPPMTKTRQPKSPPMTKFGRCLMYRPSACSVLGSVAPASQPRSRHVFATSIHYGVGVGGIVGGVVAAVLLVAAGAGVFVMQKKKAKLSGTATTV